MSFSPLAKLVIGNTKGFIRGKALSVEGHMHSASDINSGVLPLERGGTGVTNLQELKTLIGSMRIITGYYVGSGNYGYYNKNKVTFESPPLIFSIYSIEKRYNNNHNTGHFYLTLTITSDILETDTLQWSSTDNTTGTLTGVTFKDTVISWYSEQNAAWQLNENNAKYHYWAVLQ